LTSIERTAYPRFKRVVSARELHEAFTPSLAEVAWARDAVRSGEHLLALVVLLKSFQRLGRFPRLPEVPPLVLSHVRSCLDLAEDVEARHDADRTLRLHKSLIRTRSGVVHDPQRARVLVERVIRAAAQTKDNPADLINVALEELVKARLELPGYSTLDELAGTVRAEVNYLFFITIGRRLSDGDRARLLRLLEVDPARRRSEFDLWKRPARRASISRLAEHVQHLRTVDAVGDTHAWLDGGPPATVSHFAGEAGVLDAADLRKVSEEKRLALLACFVHSCRVRARDELAEMFCRRMATIHKRGREHLEAVRERQRADTERLWSVFGRVLDGARTAIGLSADEGENTSGVEPPGGEQSRDPAVREVYERAGRLMLAPLTEAGGVGRLLVEHADIRAHHGNNYMPLLARYFRSHRKALFDLLDVLELEATSADGAVLAAVRFVQARRGLTRDFIADHDDDGTPLDVSFCSQNWAKTIRDRARPGRFARRHLEACVLSYLAAELRSGDIAVQGADSYANFFDQLMTADEIAGLVGGYCAEVGLPATASALRVMVEDRLTTVAAAVDAGYPDNADLVVDEGRPVLKRRRGKERAVSAVALEKAVETRMQEVSLLDIVTRTAHWIGWYRHFGPASGSDPKLADPLGRYSVITFTYGTFLGPYQMSRHLRGVMSAHEISAPGNQHITATRLTRASADLIDTFMQLDVARLWGDGSKVGADGTQIDTWDDNLLAETSIRYGGYGGIAYRHIADTYIALFSRFIPCGVWEAVHIFEGLLDNASQTLAPDQIHADTQGQSLPAFGLAVLLGVELLPRIRNWKDLIFYRPRATSRYAHIDALFGDDVIDWKLIETHWVDLMRVAISIRQGRISSSALLRRLGNESRRNRVYKAFRELGRALRTVVLLRYLSEPGLRESITTVTNRVESFHNFAAWLAFGNTVIPANDPVHMEKVVKFNELLANCVIFYNAVELTVVLNQLKAEGHPVRAEDVAALSPYTTAHIRRFGDYVLDLSPPGGAVAVRLDLDEEPADPPTPAE
jgi:TnpA family transposase